MFFLHQYIYSHDFHAPTIYPCTMITSQQLIEMHTATSLANYRPDYAVGSGAARPLGPLGPLGAALVALGKHHSGNNYCPVQPYRSVIFLLSLPRIDSLFSCHLPLPPILSPSSPPVGLVRPELFSFGLDHCLFSSLLPIPPLFRPAIRESRQASLPWLTLPNNPRSPVRADLQHAKQS